jgi:RHS repeat-associated protein
MEALISSRILAMLPSSEANDEIPTWNQQFGYDRYGNRIALSQQINGQPVPNDNLTLPQVDPATNRFQANQGYSYDAAGNLTGDPQGRGFIFNGDNKQVEIRNAQGLVIGRYAYDGNGRRIKKTTVAETVVFVYDAHGKLVAEMSTAALPVERTVSYTATDPLGSPRVLTNGRGQVTSRRDFLPFGEEAASDGSFRRTILKYGVGDSVRQKFTGYQRDPETDLDFAEARMYEKRHGRFTAVDPLLASGKSEDPQTFNRYVYALNRPLILTDPTGMQATTQPSTAEQEAIEDAEPEQVKVTVAVSPATEKRLSVQLAMILNAAYHKEIEIVKSGNIDRQAETKKSAIKSVTESFAPSISIGGSTTGPSVNITFTPASPAKPVEAYATSSIDTTRRVEQHRIQTETAVNTVIANANTEYQDRNVSRAERNRSLEASARRALKLHQRSVH